MGVYESNDVIIFISLHQNGKRLIFASNKKITEKMKEHKTEMLLIAGYSIAIVGHLILITWLSLLLNHSLNLI